MKIYNEDTELTIYCYSDLGVFDKSIKYFVKRGTGLPINSTEIPVPEATAHSVAVFENEAWSLKKDYRGKIYNTVTLEEEELTTLGDIPKGYTDLPPPELGVWDGFKWNVDQEKLLDVEKNRLIVRIKNISDNYRRSILEHASDVEMLEWPNKVIRAYRIVSGEPTERDIKLFSIETSNRGLEETFLQLAELVIQKAERYEDVASAITGLVKNAETLITETSTYSEIEALSLSLEKSFEEKLSKIKRENPAE